MTDSTPPTVAHKRQEHQKKVLEVFFVFLRIGLTAFGGPAAHIAIMQNEVVKRRKWIDDQEFMDLIGITNLVPGPNSSEMSMHLGLVRAGWAGFFAGGFGFLIPAFLLVLGFAWAYVQFGAAPQVGWLLYGIKPVVIAIILQALWNLGKKAIKNIWLGIIGILVAAAYFLGVNEIALLFGGAVVYLLLRWEKKAGASGLPMAWFPLVGIPLVARPFTLAGLFLSFFKIGSVLYGSGYVLLAFLQAEFVDRLGWLTQQQLLDAVAVGQFTPGPFFTTATFIGYVLGGFPGAVLATLGIFLPPFIIVALSHQILRRYKDHPIVRKLLDGVIAASLGLMAAVAWQLGVSSLIDFFSIGIAVVSLAIILRYKVNSAWLVLGGALLGLMRHILLPG
ncbi:MAG: chromate efflux transporter [Anaerolineae bacterium]|nr:chromate efflux transporter [Anaerolineae bacterium]